MGKHRALCATAQLGAAFAIGWATGAVVAGVALTVWASWPWLRERVRTLVYVLEMGGPA